MRIALLAFVFLAGCTKSQKPLLQLEMYGDNQSALYVVQQNGDIAFGGGMNAIQGDTTWSGSLSQQQLDKLRSLLEATPLLSTEKKLQDRFQIASQVGDSYSKATVALTDAHATELYYFLEEATLSRVQSQLDALPKPTMDVITERELKGATQ